MNENGIDTVARLRIVADAIKAHADQFEMFTWFSNVLEDRVSKPEDCGTAACIGGWGYHIFGAKCTKLKESAYCFAGSVHSYYLDKEMAHPLGLTRNEGRLLFDIRHWPRSFNNRYDAAINQTERADIAVERIEYFIATGR